MQPSERYLDEWNTRACRAIFERDIEKWISKEMGEIGLPDTWEIKQ